MSYDTAQICINGHIINESFNDYPEFNETFCSKCGGKTITTCQSCNSVIRGAYRGGMGLSSMDLPSYCITCGKEYPWITSGIEAAKELLDLNDDLSDTEKEEILASVRELTKDSPKTEVNVLKFKKFAKKLGQDSFDALYKITIDVAAEVGKKILIGA